MSEQDELKKHVERQAKRMHKAEQDRPTLLAQTVYLGTLGLIFILPVIGGAYLGRWLDSLAAGYSTRWTISLIVLGIAIGTFNVYISLRK